MEDFAYAKYGFAQVARNIGLYHHSPDTSQITFYPEAWEICSFVPVANIPVIRNENFALQARLALELKQAGYHRPYTVVCQNHSYDRWRQPIQDEELAEITGNTAAFEQLRITFGTDYGGVINTLAAIGRKVHKAPLSAEEIEHALPEAERRFADTVLSRAQEREAPFAGGEIHKVESAGLRPLPTRLEPSFPIGAASRWN
jgi:hypothetical protein